MENVSNEEIALIFGLFAVFSYIWIRLLAEINRKIEEIRCYMYRVENMLSNDVDKMYYNLQHLRERLLETKNRRQRGGVNDN